MKIRKLIFFIIIFLLCLGGGYPTVAKPKEALNFTLTNLEHNPVNLTQFKGKTLLLDFWASWCFVCRSSFPDLKYLYGKYKNKNFLIVGITVESALEDVKAVVKKEKIPYPVLMGDNEIVLEYGIFGVPTRFLIDREGKIVKTFIGFQERKYLEEEIEKTINTGG